MTVRGWDFEGSGNSKKKAKVAAAEAALKYLNNVQNIKTAATPPTDGDTPSQSAQDNIGECIPCINSCMICGQTIGVE